MIPNAQSLVADYYDATHRGRAFGMLLAVGELRVRVQHLGVARVQSSESMLM